MDRGRRRFVSILGADAVAGGVRRSRGGRIRVRFWAAIADGLTTEEAAAVIGVPPTVGVRWSRHAGGVGPPFFPTVSDAPCHMPSTRRPRCSRSKVRSFVRSLAALAGMRRRSHGRCVGTRRRARITFRSTSGPMI